MKAYWGSGGIAPRILDLGTRWRWVVSFTRRPLYPHGNSPRYPLDRRLGGSESREPVVKRKIPRPCRSSSLWPSAVPLSYPGPCSKFRKVKAKLSTPWRRSGEWSYSSTPSLTSALDGSKWSASHPSRFMPTERAPATHWLGGWVGPRVVLDAVVKRKIPSPRRESNPRTPVVKPVAQRYTDWAITAISFITIFYFFLRFISTLSNNCS
jgi:hypothetical protein